MMYRRKEVSKMDGKEEREIDTLIEKDRYM